MPMSDKERQNFNSHTLWKDNEPGAPRLVVEGGLGICKKCGAGEFELDEFNCAEYHAWLEKVARG